MVAVVYGLDVHEYDQRQENPPAIARVINNAFHRAAWAVGLGWIVFSCHHGYGGF